MIKFMRVKLSFVKWVVCLQTTRRTGNQWTDSWPSITTPRTGWRTPQVSEHRMSLASHGQHDCHQIHSCRTPRNHSSISSEIVVSPLSLRLHSTGLSMTVNAHWPHSAVKLFCQIYSWNSMRYKPEVKSVPQTGSTINLTEIDIDAISVAKPMFWCKCQPHPRLPSSRKSKTADGYRKYFIYIILRRKTISRWSQRLRQCFIGHSRSTSTDVDNIRLRKSTSGTNRK